MYQRGMNSEVESAPLHGLCCDAPKEQRSELGEKQEQRVVEADRPAYSLPCD
jgi:hypothetical protein